MSWSTSLSIVILSSFTFNGAKSLTLNFVSLFRASFKSGQGHPSFRRVYRFYSLLIPDRITNQVSLLQSNDEAYESIAVSHWPVAVIPTDASIVSVDGQLMIDHLSTDLRFD